MREILENTLEETQSGFRRVPKQEKAFLAFLHTKKVVNKVKIDKLWKILEEREISNKIIKLIQSIYKNNINSVISNNLTSSAMEPFRQGGTLSHIPFVIFMDKIVGQTNENN